MPGNILQKAARLFYSSKFTQVIRLLEPQIFKYRDSFRYYYFLGISCLHLGDATGSLSYLNRADQLERNNTKCMLGIAAAHLIQGNIDTSLKLWIRIVDQDKNNKQAKRALKLMRKGLEYTEILERKKILKQIYPPVTRRLTLRVVIAFISVMVFSIVSVLLLMTIGRPGERQRPEVNFISVPGNGIPLVMKGENFKFEMTPEEIKDTFQKALDNFNRYRENIAHVEINRLLLSNASLEIKNSAEILKKFIKTPDFTSLKDSFTFSQVMDEPYLYQDCYVFWRGKISNLVITAEMIKFDYLVGYHTEEELEGIIRVSLNFGAKLRSGDNIEILARIVYMEGTLSLEGISIHKLAP